MSEEKILEIALKQSAEDFGCARRDFFAAENVVSILDRRSERARKDLKGEFFFDVASFGKNAISRAERGSVWFCPRFFGQGLLRSGRNTLAGQKSFRSGA